MQNVSNIVKACAIIAAIALIGIAIGMLGSRGTKPQAVQENNSPKENTHARLAETHTIKTVTPSATRTNPSTASILAVEPGSQEMTTSTPANTSANWEDAVEEIL